LRHENFVVAPDQVSAAFVQSLGMCLGGGLLFWMSLAAMLA